MEDIPIEAIVAMVAAAVFAAHTMYLANPVDYESDPFIQYGWYRSWRSFAVIGVITPTLFVGCCVIGFYHLGVRFAYFAVPLGTLLGYLSFLAARNSAKIPDDILSGLVCLRRFQKHWGPRSPELVTNTIGRFGKDHWTQMDAAIVDRELYIHMDKRMYFIPFEMVASAEVCSIKAPGSYEYRTALKFSFDARVPFTIVVLWDEAMTGAVLSRVNSLPPSEAT